MKKLILLSLVVAQSAMADFFVQYDVQGNVLGTVLSKKAPVITDPARKQVAFDQPFDTTGIMIDTSKAVNGGKYTVSKDTDKVKKDPSYVPPKDDVVASSIATISDSELSKQK